MRFSSLLASSQLASRAAHNTRQTSRNACTTALRLAQSSDFQLDNSPVIDGQTAYDCLLSFPYDSSKGKKFITELKKYIQFQSTLEVLKSPPSSYLSSPVDILSGLDSIAAKDYGSQYEFDVAIEELINSANDGHLYITPCSRNMFKFFRSGGSLVSISTDGRAAPSIYMADDLALLEANDSSVSPVTSINGQDVIKYLENIAAGASSQDPDARWNGLFTSWSALAASPSSEYMYLGQFVSSFGAWPDTNNTRLEFKNGSTIDLPTLARYTGSLQTTTTSSQALLSAACDPQSSSRNSRRDELSRDHLKREVSTEGPRGYPTPTIRDPENLVVGFALDSDTTAMLMPSFGIPENTTEGSHTLTEVSAKIIDDALAKNRTKLIIDLSSNGGGDITRAFDLFKLFFPSEFPYSATRMRRHPALDLLVLGLQDQNASVGQVSPFYWQAMVTPSQTESFASVSDYLNGGTQLATNVTSLFANFNYTLKSTDAANGIIGYAGIPAPKSPPFKPEDILILTDGVCASTCTTFVNLMTRVASVRALSFGGRPRLEAMQAMGGVRGAQSFSATLLDSVVRKADDKLLTEEQRDTINATIPNVSKLPFYVPALNVNLRNAYQEGDDETPLQFAYQAADCRLFYSAKSAAAPEESWKEAKEAVWGGGKCVEGSEGGKGSLEDRKKNGDGGSGDEGGEGGEGGKDKKGGAGSLRPGVGGLAAIGFVWALVGLW